MPDTARTVGQALQMSHLPLWSCHCNNCPLQRDELYTLLLMIC